MPHPATTQRPDCTDDFGTQHARLLGLGRSEETPLAFRKNRENSHRHFALHAPNVTDVCYFWCP